MQRRLFHLKTRRPICKPEILFHCGRLEMGLGRGRNHLVERAFGQPRVHDGRCTVVVIALAGGNLLLN